MRINARTVWSVAIGWPIALSACALMFAAPGSAETLAQAIAAAYRKNPAIDVQRAQLRATDEGVAIARSGYRPRLSATGSFNWDRTTTDTGGTTIVGPTGRLTDGGVTKSVDYEIAVMQPLFTGLQVTNRVREAEARVRAGQEQLRSAEHALFLQVVDAYTGVLSAQASISIVERAVRDAARELRSARKRLALQETTKTDVAQAEALRASALADLAGVQGELKAARAAYVEVVGHEPRRLVEPSISRRRLPRSLQEAISIAMREHPLIISALYTEQAARNNVDATRGRLLPQASLTASHGLTHDYPSDEDPGGNTRDTSFSANVTIPIYEGGANHAAVRQAKQLHVSALQQVEVERSRVRRAVATSWSQLEALRKRHRYELIRIRAEKATILGIRREETIGQRSLNDLFVAQRNLLRSENAELRTRRDVLVASYRALADIGRLNSETHLPSSTPVYDPTVHYEEVRRKWFGLSIVYSNGRQEQLNAKLPPSKAPPSK
ncbi:MAG: TolC family outer membrane protein [Hyphomicrobiaceae bacterium]